MEGGVIGGYCATGRLSAATVPVNVMTMDSTDAKIGRSMKKCENIYDTRSDNESWPLTEGRARSAVTVQAVTINYCNRRRHGQRFVASPV